MPSHRGAVNRSNYENCFSNFLPLYLNASDDCFAPREIERFFSSSCLFVQIHATVRLRRKSSALPPKVFFISKPACTPKAATKHSAGLRNWELTCKLWSSERVARACATWKQNTQRHVKNKESVPLCWFFKDLWKKNIFFADFAALS